MGYRLDLACGHEVQPGCIGIDLERRGNVIQRDIRRGIPFSSDTCSEIHINHALEHFRTGDELWFLISEIHRVLHDGGRLFIRVPHAEAVEAKHPSHLSEWNDFALRCFEPLGAPSPYTWDFTIESTARSGIEYSATLRCNKPQYVVRPEAGRFAIITAVFNQLEHTKKFIQSIRRFTHNPHQIIVINNASTDGTKEWLDAQSYLVVLHQTENLGWVEGINTGLAWLEDSVDHPDFVIFANNDTIVEGPGWERRLFAHFTDETVGAVGPTSNYVAGRQKVEFNHPGVLWEWTRTLVGFFMCVRYSVIQAVGALDDLHSFAEGGSTVSGGDDFDYSIRIAEAGYRLKIARDVFVYHAGSKSILAALDTDGYKKLCGDADKALEEKWGVDRVAKLWSHPTRVLCCIPMRSDYTHRTFTFTFSTMRKPFHFEVRDIPRAHIDTARNAAVREMKRLEFDYLMFLDDDHMIHPDTFTRLYSMDVPVASALAFQRVPPHNPCIYRWQMNRELGQMGGVPIDGYIRKGQRQVDCTGFSGVLIKAEVFEKIEDPWFEWKSKIFGEDFDFCMKCQDAGIPIYCDTDLVLPHLGENLVVTEETYYAANPEAAKLAGVGR